MNINLFEFQALGNGQITKLIVYFFVQHYQTNNGNIHIVFTSLNVYL